MTYQYENDNYGLIPFVEWMADESNYQSWFHDREVTKYNSHGLFPYTKEKMKSFLSSINNEHNVTYAIYEKRDKTGPFTTEKHIGNVSLQSISWVNRSAELAIIIGDKDTKGKGIGTQICAIMLYHAFYKLGLNRVWSGTSEHNAGMNRVFEKLYFIKEGVFKQGMWSNGMFVDVNCYRILEEEFNSTPIISQILKLGWKI
ncbi:MAG: GNAT family protein [Methanogenium sp.]|jgi:RimJ/RimL family protein N-acetyltransferase